MHQIEIAVLFIQSLVVGGLVGGATVTALIQFMKSNFIPLQFANKYPRTTTVITSIFAAIALTYAQCQAGAQVCIELVKTPLGIVAGAIAVLIVAVIIYNNMLRDKPKN